MRVVLARVGRPHGIRGDVSLDVRTDRPADRFVVGLTYLTDPPGSGPLTLRLWREGPKGTVAGFDQVCDRSGAEALRGVELVADVDPAEEEDAWYPAQLKGLRVELPDGTAVGQVVSVVAMPAQDLLEIRQPGAPNALVPLVEALVPVVDVDGGLIVIDPPAGLVAALPDPGEPQ
jgi:16S rRNA processing protein RimM